MRTVSYKSPSFFLHVADRSAVDEKHTEMRHGARCVLNAERRKMTCAVGGLLLLVGYWTVYFPSVARSFCWQAVA